MLKILYKNKLHLKVKVNCQTESDKNSLNYKLIEKQKYIQKSFNTLEKSRNQSVYVNSLWIKHYLFRPSALKTIDNTVWIEYNS